MITFRRIVLAFVAIAAAFSFASVGVADATTFTQRVSFSYGSDGATVDSAVVRGDTDSYVVEAAAGQLMKLEVVSLEDNASFAVFSPSGALLAYDESYSSLILPENGDYYIDVAPTRGNATYTLSIWIP